MIESHIFYTASTKLQSIFGYRTFLPFYGRCLWMSFFGSSVDEYEQQLNNQLLGYPSNHNYQIWKRQMIPSLKLYERVRIVTSQYPENLKSFLDFGSCKGYYVLDAAQNRRCENAIGIDVYEPFVSISTKVKKYLGLQNVNFYFATLEELSSKPEVFGGPFQTVLLIGTYHYLFWGSSFCASAFYSHREIITRLSQICTDRLIFSARLEIDTLPGEQKKRAKLRNDIKYDTDCFLTVAKEFFDVHKVGYLGRYPLFVMSKRNP